jgi:excisionase family DNA binding protein
MHQLLIDMKQTGEALSASRATIYRLIAAGKLQPFKLGRATRFRREDVEAFAASLPKAEG